MIPLGARGATTSVTKRAIGRVTSSAVPASVRPDYILRVDDYLAGNDLSGYAAILSRVVSRGGIAPTVTVPVVAGVATDHLRDGDVVAVDPTGHVRTLYRRGSRNNVLFATDRCNSYCLMCSQPPKPRDDTWRVRELLRLVELIDDDTPNLCITGGEPTLLKRDLIRVVHACKERLPRAALHVLSNGRLFAYARLAADVGAVEHPDLMIGVPLYSDLDWQHDHVVQAQGAFDQTLMGLLNLTRYGVPVEIRVVIHRWTVERLRSLAEFIYRNVPFAAHVAFMGLEATGFAVPNFRQLWIDPWDYRHQLVEAVSFLAARGLDVSVYNHQLCTVPAVVWPFCRQSISDWKNEYLPVCANCSVRGQCGGFFASNVQRAHSVHIEPVPDVNRQTLDH
jgi:His-Xaa-Ser system radical SAM maturase HxsC